METLQLFLLLLLYNNENNEVYKTCYEYKGNINTQIWPPEVLWHYRLQKCCESDLNPQNV
jgi:hypothetical protein